jgi:hypothetical protein
MMGSLKQLWNGVGQEPAIDSAGDRCRVWVGSAGINSGMTELLASFSAEGTLVLLARKNHENSQKSPRTSLPFCGLLGSISAQFDKTAS